MIHKVRSASARPFTLFLSNGLRLEVLASADERQSIIKRMGRRGDETVATLVTFDEREVTFLPSMVLMMVEGRVEGEG